jgi:hypothetical protein
VRSAESRACTAQCPDLLHRTYVACHAQGVMVHAVCPIACVHTADSGRAKPCLVHAAPRRPSLAVTLRRSGPIAHCHDYGKLCYAALESLVVAWAHRISCRLCACTREHVRAQARVCTWRPLSHMCMKVIA